MKWVGKAVGGVLGFVVGGPVGAAIGVGLGTVADSTKKEENSGSTQRHSGPFDQSERDEKISRDKEIAIRARKKYKEVLEYYISGEYNSGKRECQVTNEKLSRLINNHYSNLYNEAAEDINVKNSELTTILIKEVLEKNQINANVANYGSSILISFE